MQIAKLCCDLLLTLLLILLGPLHCNATCVGSADSDSMHSWLNLCVLTVQDTPRNMRFSINFFTSIGLGGLTDRMREHLKNLPRLIATQPAAESDSSSSGRSRCPDV